MTLHTHCVIIACILNGTAITVLTSVIVQVMYVSAHNLM